MLFEGFLEAVAVGAEGDELDVEDGGPFLTVTAPAAPEAELLVLDFVLCRLLLV